MLHVAEAFIDKHYHPTVICRGKLIEIMITYSFLIFLSVIVLDLILMCDLFFCIVFVYFFFFNFLFFGCSIQQSSGGCYCGS